MKDFRPLRFLRGGHLQTLLGYWFRRKLRWTLATEDMVVDLADGVRLLLRASWQEDREARPTLVLVHGLGAGRREPEQPAEERGPEQQRNASHRATRRSPCLAT